MDNWLSLPGADVLVAVLLLLPGLLALRIRDAMTETESRSYTSYIMASLLYVIVVYGIVALLSLVKRFGLTPLPTAPDFNEWTFLAMFIVAVVVGFVSGLVDERRWLQSAAVAANLSSKTWRSAWVDAFRDAERKWACVYLKDGTRILGWVKYHSSSAKEPTVYIARGPEESGFAQVQYLPPGAHQPTLIDGPGVLIGPDAQISHLAFLDPARPD